MSSRPNPLETLLASLAGWLPMLAGVGLLGMTLITPAWMGWRELLWQRDMLELQANGLETQKDSYAAFHDALADDDPVLLERLAFTHLRYKPVGKRLMDGASADSGRVVAVSGTGSRIYGAGFGSEMIEDWLAAPMPVVGRDIAALRPINSRLTRLTRGPSRFVLIAVAVLCLIAGFWPEESDEVRRADTGDRSARLL